MTLFASVNPAFPDTELATLAARHFGKTGAILQLPSERDQNARLVADGGDFVLKIANPEEDPGQIDLQNATMRHLTRVGQPGIPRVVQTLSGQDCAEIQVEGQPALMRLLTWIDGKPLAEAARSIAQLSALGRFMGGLTTSLQGFGHPQAFRPDFAWSLDHVIQLRGYADDITDPSRRALVERLFARYEAQVLPRLPHLRASVLHQDANDWNVITDAADPSAIAGLPLSSVRRASLTNSSRCGPNPAESVAVHNVCIASNFAAVSMTSRSNPSSATTRWSHTTSARG